MTRADQRQTSDRAVMNQRQTSDSDHDSNRRASGHDPSRVATEQRQSTDGPATHQLPRPEQTDQRQTSDRTATPTRADQQWTSDRPATDQRQTSDRRADEGWTSDRKATDEQTDKEQTPPPHATSFPKPPLHASPTSRKHHTVSAISYPRNEQPVHLRTITFLNNHLHSSSTSTISTQSTLSHIGLVLMQ